MLRVPGVPTVGVDGAEARAAQEERLGAREQEAAAGKTAQEARVSGGGRGGGRGARPVAARQRPRTGACARAPGRASGHQDAHFPKGTHSLMWMTSKQNNYIPLNMYIRALKFVRKPQECHSLTHTVLVARLIPRFCLTRNNFEFQQSR